MEMKEEKEAKKKKIVKVAICHINLLEFVRKAW